MSRRTTTSEPTVPLGELYQPVAVMASAVSLLPPEEELPDYMQRTYGVTLVRDHRNRLAVTLPDAYRVRDARMAAEAELRDDWVARTNKAAEVAAWLRARQDFWYERFMFVARSLPIDPTARNPAQAQLGAARRAMSVLVLEAEAAAGIPTDVQAQLSWPELTAAIRHPDAGDRPEDFPYRPPATEEA